MRPLLSAVAALSLLVSAGGASAQEQGVVVELYTSQGCVACPPADALFDELAAQPGVIGLSLHVDYWDYLGWTDPFGDPSHTARQWDYARAARQRSVFTPQVVVHGADMVIGHDAETIRARIAAHAARPLSVEMDAAREGGGLRIVLRPVDGAALGEMDVHVVELIPEEQVTIESGENAGRRHTYTNIVAGWVTLGRWNGAEEREFRHETGSARPHAVLVQTPGPGLVVSAGIVR